MGGFGRTKTTGEDESHWICCRTYRLGQNDGSYDGTRRSYSDKVYRESTTEEILIILVLLVSFELELLKYRNLIFFFVHILRFMFGK